MDIVQHAILSSESVLTINQRRWEEDSIDTWEGMSLEVLLKFAEVNKFSHLWIMPDCPIVPDETFSTYDQAAWSLIINKTKRGLLTTVTGWRLPRGGQHQVTIIFIKNTAWAKTKQGTQDAWIVKANPKQLLVTISYLEQALGVTIAGSPSTVGWNMLRALHPDWLQYIPTLNLQECHFTPQAAHDLIWYKPLTKKDLGAKYLYKFDKNSAYLAACIGTKYGTGNPQRTQHWYKGKVGVWRCKVNYQPAPDEVPIVCKMGEWLAGPSIEALVSQGYEVEILEGWAFPETPTAKPHVLMDAWAKKVWAARIAFRDDRARWKNATCAEYAREAVKQIATATVGLTGYKKFDPDEMTDKKRPDIKVQTIARNAEIMYHNIRKFASQENTLPIIIYMDALFYLGDKPNGREQYPSITQREKLLGGFKYEGAIEVTDDVRAILTSDSVLSSKLEQLNQIGWR